MNTLLEMLSRAEADYQQARRELLETESRKGLLHRMTVAAIAYATLIECFEQAAEEGVI